MVCEKCWDDAYSRMLTNPNKSQYEHYQDMLRERNNNPCTKEQQNGKKE